MDRNEPEPIPIIKSASRQEVTIAKSSFEVFGAKTQIIGTQ